MGVNPNSFSASIPEFWSRRMQIQRFKTNRYKIVASFEEVPNLKKGDTVDRPYRSDLTVNDMGADGSYTRQALTDTNEQLVINQEKEISFYVKDLDEIQHNYKVRNEYGDDAGKLLTNWIDGDVFGEYDQADKVVGEFEISGGGSLADGIGFTLAAGNINKVFGKASSQLTRNNIELDGRWAIISADFWNVLFQYIGGKESMLGDKTGQAGHMGKWGGFDLYVSNNLGWSARLELGTVPTATDAVVINGVTFTFVDTGDVDTAGEVYYGLNAGAAIDNLVASINTPGTSDSGIFTALSAANQKLLKGITAVDGATYMTLKAIGRDFVVVSETLTAGADIWTTTKQIQHQLFGQGKAIDLVIQKYSKIKKKERSGYVGDDFVVWTAYGIKTFKEGTKQLVDIMTRSDAY